MGYDNFECFECYNTGGGNNPCSNDGTHSDTCLKCIHEICGGGTTNRVTYALKDWHWDCSGKCERCHQTGITISILLCDLCYNRLPDEPDDPNTEYDCYLCDYEGHSHYEENEVDNVEWEPYCNNCCEEMCLKLIERKIGGLGNWDGCGYIGVCVRCNIEQGVEELPICNYHKRLVNS